MNIAKHEGVVVRSEKGCVHVKIVVNSACSACEAHGKCGFAESKDKVVAVESEEWQSYRDGDQVVVGVNEGLGLSAVLIAYFLPAVLMIAVFVVLHQFSTELWTALGTLFFVCVYWTVLALFRGKLRKRFTFSIEKI